MTSPDQIPDPTAATETNETHCLIDALKDYRGNRKLTVGRYAAVRSLNEHFFARNDNEFDFKCIGCSVMATLKIVGNDAVAHCDSQLECQTPENHTWADSFDLSGLTK